MLSMYVHIPFCHSKCAYCGFYSTPYSSQKLDLFLSGLSHECSLRMGDITEDIGTVYLGGGTPTSIPIQQLAFVIRTVTGIRSVRTDAEFTVEANPHSLTSDVLGMMAEHGVNRLSIGVQSYDDGILRFLGRLHNADQAYQAFAMARDAGFRNVGLDLIYGIPGQTHDQWRTTVEQAVLQRPEHISAYALSIDTGSRFHRHVKDEPWLRPDEDAAASQYETAVKLLLNAGYARYEVSNFSLPGFACRHNLHYWDRGENIGFGPGAWSFIRGRRSHMTEDLETYSRETARGRIPFAFSECASVDEAASEVLMLRLRTEQGLDLAGFEKQFGPAIRDRLAGALMRAGSNGLYIVDNGMLRLTERGIMLSNEAITALLS